MIGAALAVAAVLFLVDLALSVMTLAASALSRVALRRLNTDSGGALPFLDEFKVVPSSHRAAIHTVREASLVGGAGLLAWCASELHVPGGYATGLLAGILVGTILLETVIARALALRDPRTSRRSSRSASARASWRRARERWCAGSWTSTRPSYARS